MCRRIQYCKYAHIFLHMKCSKQANAVLNIWRYKLISLWCWLPHHKGQKTCFNSYCFCVWTKQSKCPNDDLKQEQNVPLLQHQWMMIREGIPSSHGIWLRLCRPETWGGEASLGTSHYCFIWHNPNQNPHYTQDGGRKKQNLASGHCHSLWCKTAKEGSEGNRGEQERMPVVLLTVYLDFSLARKTKANCANKHGSGPFYHTLLYFFKVKLLFSVSIIHFKRAIPHSAFFCPHCNVRWWCHFEWKQGSTHQCHFQVYAGWLTVSEARRQEVPVLL